VEANAKASVAEGFVGGGYCAEVAWPSRASETTAVDTTVDDELQGCSEIEVDGCTGGSGGWADEEFTDAEDLLATTMLSPRLDAVRSEDEVSLDRDVDDDEEASEEKTHAEVVHDQEEEVHSDASSEASEKEDAIDAVEANSESARNGELAVAQEAEELQTVPKKKKKRKRKRRKSTKEVAEEPNQCKRPPVPRFPHPSTALVKNDADLLPSAATTVPSQPLKDRLSKHLMLGRFPRRPLVTDGNQEEGVAQSGETANGGDLGEEVARSSTSPALEAENPPLWSLQPRRSQSHDGSAHRVRANGEEAWRSRSGDAGKTSTAVDRGRSAVSSSSAPSNARVPRARSEAPRGDAESSGLSIVGVQSKAIPKKVGSKQWLASALAEQKKQAEEAGDATLNSLYLTFSSMKDADGRKVALKSREKVVRTLHELSTKVAIPLSRYFGLRYNFFSEHHCQAKKAGVTVKEPLVLRKQLPDGEMTEETRYFVTIRLRLRVHPSKGDPHTQFISRGTQLAVLLHELCHLKHMNHGKDFMLFLRDIFAQATKLGVFKCAEMDNEIPSPWPWENEIFRTGGEVGN
jgi:hypothetical protein